MSGPRSTGLELPYILLLVVGCCFCLFAWAYYDSGTTTDHQKERTTKSDVCMVLLLVQYKTTVTEQNLPLGSYSGSSYSSVTIGLQTIYTCSIKPR